MPDIEAILVMVHNAELLPEIESFQHASQVELLVEGASRASAQHASIMWDGSLHMIHDAPHVCAPIILHNKLLIN